MRDDRATGTSFPTFLLQVEVHAEWNSVNAQDEYRHKASECLDLASKTASKAGGGIDSGTDSAWHKFTAMAMLWLRLAEESERLNRHLGRDRA
jgi:hypothetical protein